MQLAGKPFTPEERVIALPSTYIYRPAATAGYPYLMRKGQELIEQGVEFFDLTGMFRNNREALYIDACCHLNGHGYELVAMHMAELISDRLAEKALSLESTARRE